MRVPSPLSRTAAPRGTAAGSCLLFPQSHGPSFPIAHSSSSLVATSPCRLMGARGAPCWLPHPCRAPQGACPRYLLHQAHRPHPSATSRSPTWRCTKTPTPRTAARRRRSPSKPLWPLASAGPTPSAQPHPCGTDGRCPTGTIGGDGVGGLGLALCVALWVIFLVTPRKMTSARGCSLPCMLPPHLGRQEAWAGQGEGRSRTPLVAKMGVESWSAPPRPLAPSSVGEERTGPWGFSCGGSVLCPPLSPSC